MLFKYDNNNQNQDRAERAEAEIIHGSLFYFKSHFTSRPEIGSEGPAGRTMPRQNKCDTPPMVARTRPFRQSGP